MKSKIKDFILEIEDAESLEELANIKKMRGFVTACRWRVGDYRLGFYKNENTIEIARFVKRNNIYKIFP